MTAPADGTALYRIWGEGDVLLYIGISKRFGKRWEDHAREQPWWGEMRRLSVDAWHQSRTAAEEAEENAIKAERPKYNKTHNGKRVTAAREDVDGVQKVINRMALITPALEAEIRAAAERAPKKIGRLCVDAGRPCLRASPGGCYGGSRGMKPCILDAPWSEGIRADGLRWVRDPAEGWRWKAAGVLLPPGSL
jgi:hypothetical protein